ncbi:MAG: hypothetical protein R3F30_06465 [Planctomycetota bacterium]
MAETVPAAPTSGRPSARAWLGPLVVFGVALAGLGLLLQRVPYGDGILLEFALGKRIVSYHHLTYLLAVTGWADLCEAVGAGRHGAYYLWSAVAAAGGLAALWATMAELRRGAVAGLAGGGGGLGDLSALLLVATTPALLFFGTTLENPAHHLGCTALAMLLVVLALRRDTPSRWLAAGLACLLVVTSHASGLALMPLMGLLALWRSGRAPLRDGVEGSLLRLALLAAPVLAFRLGEQPLRAWLFAGQGVTAEDPASNQLRWLLSHRPGLGEVVDHLVVEVCTPYFGLVLATLAACVVLLRRGRGRFVGLAVLGIGLHVGLFVLYGVRERGAYGLPVSLFAALLVQVALGAARPAALARAAVLVLAVAQLVAGVHAVRAYPTEKADPPWQWAARCATALGPEAPGGGATVLVADLFRGMHLEVDHDVRMIHVPSFLDLYTRGLAELVQGGASVAEREAFGQRFLGECRTRILELEGRGTLWVTGDCAQVIREVFPPLHGWMFGQTGWEERNGGGIKLFCHRR